MSDDYEYIKYIRLPFEIFSILIEHYVHIYLLMKYDAYYVKRSRDINIGSTKFSYHITVAGSQIFYKSRSLPDLRSSAV